LNRLLGAKTQYGNKVADGDKDAVSSYGYPQPAGVVLYDGKNDDGTPKYKNSSVSSFNTLSIKFGAEARYPIGEKLYLNAQWLYGITLNSAVLKSMEKQLEDSYDTPSGGQKISFFTQGSTFKLAVGYAF
jgi:hypothetical protein